jgi:hypothetical protein
VGRRRGAAKPWRPLRLRLFPRQRLSPFLRHRRRAPG